MARRRAPLSAEDLPGWVTHPEAADYLTPEQLAHELWPLHALLAHQRRLRDWCEQEGLDWVPLAGVYPA